MNEVTLELLAEFKERIKLSDDEDANLTRILESSIEDLLYLCGDYDISKDKVFKSLVFERSRYEYNDALEYFYHNFLTQINTLAFKKYVPPVEEGEEYA